MKITKKQKIITILGGLLLVTTATAVPLIVQSTKQKDISFNLSTIKNQMQRAVGSRATLEETKVTMVRMYQNDTTGKLSLLAKKAAQALAQYVYDHKASQKFDFKLGKDHQGKQLLLLTITKQQPKTKNSASLQRSMNELANDPQRQDALILVRHLPWVASALQEVEFGILFWIHQNKLSSQEVLAGTSEVPLPLQVVNFQRMKTVQELLQDKAWVKIIQVVQGLTTQQLNIKVNAKQLPSQTKITPKDIVLVIKKLIHGSDALSRATRNLISEVHIKVQFDDQIGVIRITISKYGSNKIIAIHGFKTTGSPLAIAQAKIDVAQAKADVILPTKLNQVFHGQVPREGDVNPPTKKGITFTFHSALPINDQGESSFTYTVDVNPQVVGTTTKEVIFIVGGFESKVQKAAREVIKNQLDPIFQNIRGGVLVIPNGITSEQFDEYVKAMGGVNKFVQRYRVHITSLTIPNSFTTIDNWFQNFDKIVSLVVGSNVIAIGNHAFANSPLTSLTWGAKVQTIGNWAFNRAQLVSLTISASVTTIGDGAFYHSPLTSLTWGAKVQTIGNWAFNRAQLVSLTISASVTTIGDGAFQESPLTSLTLGANLQSIGGSAFKDAKLTGLIIPNLVTTIETHAFYHSPLESLTLGANLQSIGIKAFKDAKLTGLIIPDLVTTIWAGAFQESPLTSLRLGAKLQTIGSWAFQKAQLTHLTIPNLVTAIGNSAFANSPLTSLTWGAKVQTIGNWAFNRAQLASLTILASVTTIGVGAFQNSPLTTITIFDDVILGRDAFKNAKQIIRQARPPKK